MIKSNISIQPWLNSFLDFKALIVYRARERELNLSLGDTEKCLINQAYSLSCVYNQKIRGRYFINLKYAFILVHVDPCRIVNSHRQPVDQKLDF